MVLVEWPSHEAFDAFVADPEHEDLHPLREHGTERYLWWLFDRLDDLRPLFALGRDDLVRFTRRAGDRPRPRRRVAGRRRRARGWPTGCGASRRCR